MRQLTRVLSVIDNISEWTGKIASFVIVFFVLFTVYEVVMRYIFNSPTLWTMVIVQMLFGGAYLLMGSYTLRHKGHVNIDIIVDRFYLGRRAIIDMVTSVLFFTFCWVVFWWGIDFFWRSWELKEVTQELIHAPVYPLKLMMPIGGGLILLQGLAKFIRDFITAITGREAPATTGGQA